VSNPVALFQVNNFQKSFRLLSSDIVNEIENFWSEHRHQELEGRTKILESFCPQVIVQLGL
jgi:hypothetical protein